MSVWLRNVLLAAAMLAASGLAVALRPTHKMAEQGPKVDLESMIPHAFGKWREETQRHAALVVDPQQKELSDRIYSQVLSRTYLDDQGYRIMLLIAYGDDQRDALKMHYPEVCYPAQGFRVAANNEAVIDTGKRSLPVRRLETQRGPERHEPVTYWAVIGEIGIRGGVDKKIAELHYGLAGAIPDGLLFRVSSIDPVPGNAFLRQQGFVSDLLEAVAPEHRSRLFGKE